MLIILLIINIQTFNCYCLHACRRGEFAPMRRRENRRFETWRKRRRLLRRRENELNRWNKMFTLLKNCSPPTCECVFVCVCVRMCTCVCVCVHMCGGVNVCIYISSTRGYFLLNTILTFTTTQLAAEEAARSSKPSGGHSSNKSDDNDRLKRMQKLKVKNKLFRLALVGEFLHLCHRTWVLWKSPEEISIVFQKSFSIYMHIVLTK